MYIHYSVYEAEKTRKELIFFSQDLRKKNLFDSFARMFPAEENNGTNKLHLTENLRKQFA